MGCFDFARRRDPAGERAGLVGAASQNGQARGRCCGCLPSRSGSAAGASAEAQATDALKDIVAGYKKLAQLALPAGAALALAGLRRDILHLEALVQDVQFPKQRPWMLPLPEEQSDWEQLCPQGGLLLRQQVCMACTEDEECYVGGLLISDEGLVFDTGDDPDDSESFNTGFVPWRNIRDLERPGPKTELLLKFSGLLRLRELKLHLSIASDIEWIEEFWNLRNAYMAYDTTVPEEDATICVPASSARPRLLLPHAVERSPFERTPSLLSPTRKPGDASSRSMTLLQRKMSRGVSGAWVTGDGTGKGEPDSPGGAAHYRQSTLESNGSGLFEAPGGRKVVQLPTESPTCEDRLAHGTVEELNAALRQEGCIPKVVIRGRKAEEVSASKWTESKRSPGVFVKKATFRIPLPQDFPKAVTRLVTIPTETKITAVYRLRLVKEGEMILTLQTCSHDVPYGENFRVHETVYFETLPTKEVVVKKWVEIMWVASLPWTHGMLKGIIESKTKAEAASDLTNLLTVLKEVAKIA